MVLTVTLNAAIDKRYVVENYQVGEVNRVKECAFVAGGKGLNVSKTARIAGADVLATGFVGGHAGAYIIEAVEKQDVKTDFIQVKGESRSCINIYDSVKCINRILYIRYIIKRIFNHPVKSILQQYSLCRPRHQRPRWRYIGFQWETMQDFFAKTVYSFYF